MMFYCYIGRKMALYCQPTWALLASGFRNLQRWSLSPYRSFTRPATFLPKWDTGWLFYRNCVSWILVKYTVVCFSTSFNSSSNPSLKRAPFPFLQSFGIKSFAALPQQPRRVQGFLCSLFPLWQAAIWHSERHGFVRFEFDTLFHLWIWPLDKSSVCSRRILSTRSCQPFPRKTATPRQVFGVKIWISPTAVRQNNLTHLHMFPTKNPKVQSSKYWVL